MYNIACNDEISGNTRAEERLENKLDGIFSELNKKLNDSQKCLSDASSLLQNSIAEVRNVIISNLVEENKRLRERVTALERKTSKIEKIINTNQQKNNVEFEGIPDSIQYTDLENAVTKILKNLPQAIVCTAHDHVACHRLPGKKPSTTAIIKTKNRKLIEKIIRE